MPIRLITGVPGSGKSALVVKLLSELPPDRLVYVHGIPELKLPHVPLEDPRKWHETVPDGAMVVIDEVQHHWRAAGPSQRIPDDIAALETHRHRGIDFIICTQGPKLIHQNVRNLVSPHSHIRNRGFLGRNYYEWPECSESLAWRTAPIKSKYKLPKKIFSQYRSATEHTPQPHRIPPVLIVLVLAIVGMIVCGVFLYRSIASKVKGDTQTAKPATVAPGAPGTVSLTRSSSSSPPTWPIYSSGRVIENREPYDLRGLQLEGEYSIGQVRHAMFGLVVGGQRVASVTLHQLVQAGYVWTALAPCSGVLRWRDLERPITCAPRAIVAPAGPAPAASAGQVAPA